MKKYVNTLWLNLRTAPSTAQNNKITQLTEGQEVLVLQEIRKWSRIKTTLDSIEVEGFSESKYLSKMPPSFPIVSQGPVAVHREENIAMSTPNSREYWTYPIGDADRKVRDSSSKQRRIDSIYEIVEYLNVEESIRYEPKRYTYCNIYAYDYAYLCGAYLPRIWWCHKAIERLARGEAVEIKYGQTIREMTANMLFDWLVRYGSDFGWKRLHTPEDLQKKANEGRVCIISARHKVSKASGHICAVIPEAQGKKATTSDNGLFSPVMTQAGRNNRKFFSTRWWTSAKFSNFGFFFHE